MTANVDPIFPLTPKSAWATLTTANAAKDGTGTVNTVCTAGPNGEYVESITAIPIGTNVASVLRVFINNGSTNATATNNSLRWEVSLPGTTLTDVTAQVPVTIPIQKAIPANYKLNVVLGTAVAAGWQVTCDSDSY
ncbi:MAG TPA: hypothetical protein VF472_21850 [Burkholderiaceae bacterium]